MDIGKGVVVVTFLEIDGVQDFDAVLIAPQRISALRHNTALRKRFVKTECAFYLQTFYEQRTSCLDGGFIRTWRRCECRS